MCFDECLVLKDSGDIVSARVQSSFAMGWFSGSAQGNKIQERRPCGQNSEHYSGLQLGWILIHKQVSWLYVA